MSMDGRLVIAPGSAPPGGSGDTPILRRADLSGPGRMFAIKRECSADDIMVASRSDWFERLVAENKGASLETLNSLAAKEMRSRSDRLYRKEKVSCNMSSERDDVQKFSYAMWLPKSCLLARVTTVSPMDDFELAELKGLIDDQVVEDVYCEQIEDEGGLFPYCPKVDGGVSAIMRLLSKRLDDTRKYPNRNVWGYCINDDDPLVVGGQVEATRPVACGAARNRMYPSLGSIIAMEGGVSSSAFETVEDSIVGIEPNDLSKVTINGDKFRVEYGGGKLVVKPKVGVNYVESKSTVTVVNKRYPTDTMIVGDLPKGKLKINGRKYRIEGGRGWSVILMYTMVMCLLCTSNGLLTGYTCGDDKHGSIWQMPEVKACRDHPDEGKVVVYDVWREPDWFGANITHCYERIDIDVTMLGLWGTKSHLSSKAVMKPVSVEVCRGWAASLITSLGKLVSVGDGLWSTTNSHTFDYRYCCSSDTYQTRNYVMRKALAHVYALRSMTMLAGDIPLRGCKYDAGECVSETGVSFWDVKEVGKCKIEKIGRGNFTVLPDGGAFSKELQISAKARGSIRICDRLMRVTDQGIFLEEIATLAGRDKRDIDSAEKGFILEASQRYTDGVSDGLSELACLREQLFTRYLLDTMYNNPTSAMRAYMNRTDIAAKFVGDRIMIWECEKVVVTHVYYGHKKDGVCYNYPPVEYEMGRSKMVGYMQYSTGEIMPVSGSHDCDSMEGYYHKVDGDWRFYTQDGNYTPNPVAKPLPTHTVGEDVKKFVFRDNEVHSVYGPMGSRYQDGIIGELAALSARLLSSEVVYANPVYQDKVSMVKHNIMEGVSAAIALPIILSVKIIVLFGVICIILYCMRQRMDRAGLPRLPGIVGIRRRWLATNDVVKDGDSIELNVSG